MTNKDQMDVNKNKENYSNLIKKTFFIAKKNIFHKKNDQKESRTQFLIIIVINILDLITATHFNNR